MKQTKKLHPFMDHLKKAKKQNAEFVSWLAMADKAFNNKNAERAFPKADIFSRASFKTSPF